MTTIEVSSRTWKRLNVRKSQGQSFDDVVVGLLDEDDAADASAQTISEADR